MIHIPVKHFFMLRHGESAANADRIYSGQIDTPLTVRGQEQAQDIIAVIDTCPVKPKIAVHSHLQRARDTARPTAAYLDLELVETPAWAEQHYGDWQGVAHQDVRHLREAGINPPNGETNIEFTHRIAHAAAETLNQYEIPLIVCHGGCFRALAAHYGLKINGSENATLYEFIPKTSEDDNSLPWEVYQWSQNGKSPVWQHDSLNEKRVLE